MIKKIIFGIFILLLGIIGFSNAGKVQMVGIDSYPSIYNNQYNLSFLKGGGVLSNYLGQGKSVLALNSNIFFRRATNGLPYFYGPYSQGFFDTYCSCDVISDYDRTPETANCTCNPITGDAKALFKGFFSNVKQDDLAYYDVDQTYNNYPSCTQKRYQGKFCRSSTGINSTLCFAFRGECINTCQGPSICNGLMGGGLSNSQGLENLTYGLIHDAWIGYAPGQLGYDGGQTEIPDGDLSNISCPTIQQVINNYNSKGFYSGLCYTFGKIYNGSTFEDVPVKSIFEVFSGKEDYLNWYEGYVTYCKSSVYNPAVCTDYFSGNSYKYNILAKIPDVSMVGGGKLLYTYCGLYDYDPNATTCVTQGTIPEVGTEITNNDIIDSIGHGEYTIVSPVTNNTEYNTVFNNGSGYEFSGDIITNIQQLFGKFTSLFKQQTGNIPGILPLWIIVPFIIIVLFKLFKK